MCAHLHTDGAVPVEGQAQPQRLRGPSVRQLRRRCELVVRPEAVQDAPGAPAQAARPRPLLRCLRRWTCMLGVNTIVNNAAPQ